MGSIIKPMRANYSLLPILLSILLYSTISEAQTLKIEISNIQKHGGVVNIAIFDKESDWMDTPMQTTTVETESDSEVVSFELPYGSYAVSVFQDVDGNNELDTNFMGIPKEPIAFGNNYKPFGKPKFKDAALNFDKDYKIQTLKLYTIL